ncbi:MAG: hypothetical protein IT377_07335 [Polyangiaceae bacterium]|nr:hypothetical protein [Polyangiaceae bacterium]
MNERDSSGFWDDAEVVSSYSRAQAIEDGVLVDVTATSKEAGFTVPVAVTAAVWCEIEPTDTEATNGQSVSGRLWDILSVLRASAGDTDTVLFDVLVARDHKNERLRLKAIIGPGDDAAPVITIMLPNED